MKLHQLLAYWSEGSRTSQIQILWPYKKEFLWKHLWDLNTWMWLKAQVVWVPTVSAGSQKWGGSQALKITAHCGLWSHDWPTSCIILWFRTGKHWMPESHEISLTRSRCFWLKGLDLLELANRGRKCFWKYGMRLWMSCRLRQPRARWRAVMLLRPALVRASAPVMKHT